MSRILANVTNVDGPDSDYLKGRIRNKSASPAIVGSPVVEEIYGDMIQTFQKMLSLAGITENDLPDNETNGYQMLQAVQKFAEGTKFTDVVSSNSSHTETGTFGVKHVDLTYNKTAGPTGEKYRYNLDTYCNELFADLTANSADGNSSTIEIYQGATLLITITTTTTQTKYFYIKKIGGTWLSVTFDNVGGTPISVPFS